MPDGTPTGSESPPAKITHGSASLTGYGGAAALAAAAIADVIAGNGVDADSRAALFGAVALAAVTMLGRFAQAVAAEMRRGPTSEQVTGILRERVESAGVQLPLSQPSATSSTTGRTLQYSLAGSADSLRPYDAPYVSPFEGAGNGDATIAADPDDFPETWEAAGDEDDDRDLHDRHDVSEGAKG